ncbi:MAG: WD40 repeat domain-containing protein [Chloroflexi bacterium]|nr:MAG: WD40 repeat domain-containing protein [Chloroflexota bacterium]
MLSLISSMLRLFLVSFLMWGIGTTQAQPASEIVITQDNVQQLQLVRIIRAHEDAVRDIVFSPDGRYIVTASDYLDNTVRVWRIDSGERIAEMNAHVSGVLALAYHPRRNLIASAGGDGMIRLWDVTLSQVLRTFSGHDGSVLDVAFNPEATILASAGEDGSVQLWDVARGNRLQLIDDNLGAARRVMFSADGAQLMILYCHATVIRSVEGGKLVDKLDIELFGTQTAIAENGAATRIVVSDGESVRWWDARTFDETHPPIPVTNINDLAFTLEDDVLAGSKLDDGAIHLWDAETGEQLVTLPEHRLGAYSIAFNPAGTLLAVGGGDGTVLVWAVGDGAVCHVIARATANLRAEPGTQFRVEDVLRHNVGARAILRTIDDEGFTWWQVENGLWIRDDAVVDEGNCDDLPIQ